MKLVRLLPLFSLFGVALILGQSSKDTFRVPLGLTPILWPKDNPYSADKAHLGRLLYYDKRLSADNSVACASCHAPDKGFTDQL
ncbi:MAG: cytochrome-c peroxidase, partial [Acidobacteriota bacterium]